MSALLPIRRSLGWLDNPSLMSNNSLHSDYHISPFFFSPFFNYENSLFNNRLTLGDVSENENNYIVKAEIPGIPSDNVKVTIDGKRVTIDATQSSSSPDEALDNPTNKVSKEVRNFHYSTLLPGDVDINNVVALTKDGIITITLPKLAKSSPVNITVKSS